MDNEQGRWVSRTTAVLGTCFILYSLVGLTTPSHAHSFAVTHPLISGGEIIARAQSWVAVPVLYNERSYFQSYRQDCSGLVSMAWQLLSANQQPESLSTYTLPTVSHPISKDDLQPGDILLNQWGGWPAGQYGSPNAHVVIFASWADAAHTLYNAYEESPYYGHANYTTDMPYPYWSGYDASDYIPMRLNSLSTSPTPAPTPDPTNTPTPTPPTPVLVPTPTPPTPTQSLSATLTPASGSVGTSVTATGGGWLTGSASPGNQICIFFNSGGGSPTACTTLNQDGTFTINFNVPANEAAGQQLVTIEDLDASLNQTNVTFTVTPLPTPISNPTPHPTLTTDCGHLVTPWVALYQYSNFGGRELCSEGTGLINLADYGFDKQTQSINIAANGAFFNQPNGQSNQLGFYYGDEQADLGSWDNQISSLIVYN